MMPLQKLFTSLLRGLVVSNFFLSTIATPVRRDVPDALRPRQSAATPHPLDYAPDFSKDPFPPWPNVYNDDGSNITTENWRGTKLFGWKGCDDEAKRIIVETMKQFYKLAQQEALYKDIDWESQAAKEIWGHGTGNKEILDNVKLQIKQIYESTQQIYDKNWWVPPYIYDPPWVAWRNLWIRVQCSPDGDDSKQCHDDKPDSQDPCSGGQPPNEGDSRELEAYSDPLGWYSKITFCKLFFNRMPDLDYVINTAKKNSRSYQNDLWNYQNRARLLFHEMTHLNYFMSAPDKSPYVDDVKIRWKEGKKNYNLATYGPERIKMLANYEAVKKGGFFTQRNADSYAWFAMAKYIEQEVKLYPSDPVVSRKPSKAPTDGDGKTFAASADGLSAEADTDDQSHTDDTNHDHQVPACEDHPVQSTNTFGASTVNDGAQTDCDTNSLSGVHYNAFYAQGNNVNHPNVYDNFCKGIDGTANGYWFADSHGNKVPDPPGVATTPRRSMLRRTLSSLLRRAPPPPTTDPPFTVELTWTKDDAGNGCGQTVESCRAAFAKLAQSPCGHQGGEKNSMTTEAKITLPQCGAYSFKFVGADAGGAGNQASSDAQPSGSVMTLSSGVISVG